MRKCSIDGCDNKHRAKGYCIIHYRQLLAKRPLPIRVTWTNMKLRCYDRNHISYLHYGGRGIKICDEWLHDFEAFHDYIGDRPTPNHSIDRINNNGNYEPGNVRWATRHEQCANRSSNNEIVGVCFNKSRNKWHAGLCINKVYVLDNKYRSYNEAVEARKKAEIKYGIDNSNSVMYNGA